MTEWGFACKVVVCGKGVLVEMKLKQESTHRKRIKMIEKIKGLFTKYEEIVVYLIVGVINTIVSWAACFLVGLFLNPDISWQNFMMNTVGWVAGVVFGYFANRKYVFKSTNPERLKEFLGFAGGRVSTWIMDIVIMFLLVNLIHMNYWIAKVCISSVLVMIANYLLSKFFVFNKKDK